MNDFVAHSRDVGREAVGRYHACVEVAVGALRLTERNLDV